KAAGQSRKQRDAEVLGMAVRRTQQPEEDLRGHERTHVLLGIDRLLQQGEDLAQTRPALVLVLYERRCPGGLAAVFLHEAKKPLGVAGKDAVETLDDEHTLLTEGRDVGRRNPKAIGLENA